MRVRALRDFDYANRAIKAGEEFDTEIDMHGTLLIQAQSAEAVVHEPAAKPGRYKRRDMRADE